MIFLSILVFEGKSILLHDRNPRFDFIVILIGFVSVTI